MLQKLRIFLEITAGLVTVFVFALAILKIHAEDLILSLLIPAAPYLSLVFLAVVLSIAFIRLRSYQVAQEKVRARSALIEKHLSNVSNSMHVIIHEGCSVLNLMDSLVNFSAARKKRGSTEEMERLFYELCGFILNEVAALFTEILQDKCSASLKLIERADNRVDGGAIYVHTFRRDKDSDRLRIEEDRKIRNYKFDRNYAIKLILSENGFIQREHKRRTPGFLRNDIVATCPEYETPNSRWRDFYNNIIVLPIQFDLMAVANQRRIPGRTLIHSSLMRFGNKLDVDQMVDQIFDEQRVVLGFLTVDCMNSKFSDDYLIAVLEAICDYMYHIISGYYFLKGQMLENNIRQDDTYR